MELNTDLLYRKGIYHAEDIVRVLFDYQKNCFEFLYASDNIKNVFFDCRTIEDFMHQYESFFIAEPFLDEFQEKFNIDYMKSNLSADNPNYYLKYTNTRTQNKYWYLIKLHYLADSPNASLAHAILTVKNSTQEMTLEEINNYSLQALKNTYAHIACINLNTHVFYYIKDGAEPKRELISTEDFFKNIKHAIPKLVHPSDVNYLLENWTDKKFKKHFDKSDEALIFDYRSGTVDNHKWVRTEFVRDKDYDEKHRVIILLDRTITKEKAIRNRYYDMVACLSDIYFSIHHVNIQTNVFWEVSTSEQIRQIIGSHGCYSKANLYFAEKYVVPKDRQKVIDFLDRTTMPARFKRNPNLNCEYMTYEFGWCRLSIVVAKRDQRDTISHVLVLSTVIDEEKKKSLELQEKLAIALSEANAASKAKTEFLSRMSHDIRTPMNAIIGMNALARNHLEDPKTLTTYLDKMNSASHTLLDLINDVLDMNRIESGKIIFNEDEVYLEDVFSKTKDLIRPGIYKRNQNFHFTVSNVEHDYVLADATKLQEIFLNILSNAVKYTNENGNITVTIEELPSDKKNYYKYKFSCIDDGIGMSEEYLPHIFDVFSRESDNRQEIVATGTGLGLSIVKKYIEKMGGTIQVESKLNEGSTFTITLYFRIPERKIKANPLLFDKNIYVITENEKLSKQFVADIESFNIHAIPISTATEFLENLTKNCPEPYLSIFIDFDIVQQNKNYCKQLRENVPVPVIIYVMTKHGCLQCETQKDKMGIDELISTNKNRGILLRALNHIADFIQKFNAESAKEKETDFSEKHVLVVEDIEINREIILEFLTVLGAKVSFAENGKEAVEKMAASAKNEYDLIFMDIMMPIMNGYESTEAIRALDREDSKNIPIIAMTANAFADDVKKALSVGMNAHIAKPIDLGKIQEALEEWG